jgi:cob(I)alamin adenosyltransferase
MEKWNKMKEELELINKKSFKGKSTIESATVLSDIDTTNKRDDMFTVIKELYNLSKKLAKPNKQDTSNIEEVIKKQLADVLPGLLKTALSSVPALQNKENTSVNPM